MTDQLTQAWQEYRLLRPKAAQARQRLRLELIHERGRGRSLAGMARDLGTTRQLLHKIYNEKRGDSDGQ